MMQFISEMYAIARLSRVVVYPWDSEAYPEVVIKNANEFRRRIAGKIKGGGGTVIAPVLEKCLDNMKQGDIVCILTDGYIYDIKHWKTVELLQEISRRASVAIYVYTSRYNQLQGKWKELKLD